MLAMQGSLDEVQSRVREVERQISTARSSHAMLQRDRAVLSARLASASEALAAAATCASAAPLATPPVAALRSQTSVAGAPRHPRQRTPQPHTSPVCDTPTSSANPTAPPAADAQGSHRAAVRVPHQRRAGLYDRHAQDGAPRAIHAFRRHAAVSYRDLHAMAGGSSDLINFTQHSFGNLLDAVLSHKATLLEAPGGCDDVCWFPQAHYDAAPGTPLSTSATLSSPECLASFAVVFLLTRLELALITAVADQAGSAVGSKVACGLDIPPPNGPQRMPALPHCVTDAAPAAPTAAAAQPAGPCTPEGTRQPPRRRATRSAGCAEGCGLRPGSDHQPGRGLLWSGLLRCGINDTHDGRAAVSRIVRDLMLRFSGRLPRARLQRVIERYLLFLRDAVGKAAGMSAVEADGRREAAPGWRSGSPDRGAFMAGAVAAAVGATALLQEELCLATARMHGPHDPVQLTFHSPAYRRDAMEVECMESTHGCYGCCTDGVLP